MVPSQELSAVLGHFATQKNLPRTLSNAVRLKVVGRGGLEPPTSRLSGVRSNHLSYRPNTGGNPCF